VGEVVQRILIVEDSATMRAMLTTALEGLAEPVKIVEAESGFDALRQLPRDGFDLIVTDINMPDINGLELVSFVKGNPAFRAIPLLIISTESSERDRARGVDLGADAYLVKPFEAAEFREMVTDLLARPRRDG
jgi:two-component system chemotaxis response regulator CheY